MRNLLTRLAAAALDLRRSADPRTRSQYVAARHAFRFRDKARSWSTPQKQLWIRDALRTQAARAVHNFDFWRTRFAQAAMPRPEALEFEHLSLLPPLEREDLPELFAEARKLDRAAAGRVERTGGSTGVPAELLKGPEERGWSESASPWFRAQVGVPRHVRTAFVWGHHLDPVARDSWRARVEDFCHQQAWFDIFRIDDETLRRYDRALTAFRPELIVAYAAALDALAAAVNPDGQQRRPYPTRAIITGAEKLLPHHRARLEATFAAPVYEQYGGRDFGLLAHQLDASSPQLVVDWANVLVEPEHGDEVAPILVTKLHADAMPLFRYRVGDLARFPTGSQPGHPALVLDEVVGRELNMLWRPDGTRVSGMLFPHLLKDFSLREFQIQQVADLSVTALIVPRDGFSEAQEREIRHIIEANLPGCTVSVQRVGSVPRGANRKLHPVIAPASVTLPSGQSLSAR